MPKSREKEKMLRRSYTLAESVIQELEEVAAAEFECNNSLALRTAIRQLHRSYKKRQKNDQASSDSVED